MGTDRVDLGDPVEGPHSRSLASPVTDVKFISNPPSMVAAGSVVAAVQGLRLGSSSSVLSYHRLTRFLSRVIKCDPVSDLAPPGDLAGPTRPLRWGTAAAAP